MEKPPAERSGHTLVIGRNERVQGQHAAAAFDPADSGLLERQFEMHVRDAERIRTQIRDGDHLHHPVPTPTAEAVTASHLDFDRLAAVLQKTFEQVGSSPETPGLRCPPYRWRF